MIKEEKNIDFYTTGKQPSEQDFARISEWIIKDKQKNNANKQAAYSKNQTNESRLLNKL